ncbi:MAG: DEAD/DEAH box helicase [Phycisphaerae bacterium]
MTCVLKVTPEGKLLLVPSDNDPIAALPRGVEQRIVDAFAGSESAGLLHLATVELETPLTPVLSYFRDFAREYLVRLCHTPGLETTAGPQAIPIPAAEELSFRCMQAPPMPGLEYLNADTLIRCWNDLDQFVRGEIARVPGGTAAYLREKNPIWRLVGRVTFHLAENKRDLSSPFAFLATYTNRLTAQATLRHLPLNAALQEYAGAGNRERLIALLTPIERAAEKSQLVRELVESGDIYHPLAWTAETAYRFLRDVPVLEDSGLIVRVPNWWRASKPSRAVVSVKIGQEARTRLDADALLDFSVNVTVDGQVVNAEELKSIMAASEGLMLLKGRWVEIDQEKLAQTLEIWKQVEAQAGSGGLSFLQSMRMLSGVGIVGAGEVATSESVQAWSDVVPGDWLAARLAELRHPEAAALGATPKALTATLRAYQQVGVAWLTFMSRLGLGACLADDMGLGKTIQVLALLLRLKEHHAGASQTPPPSLLIVPASLIANWLDELARFAPTLKACVAHPSEKLNDWTTANEEVISHTIAGMDLVITTYGMATRLEWLTKRLWNIVILDEAQAIKNSGTKQTRCVKQLRAAARVALTGTPVENRLSDLWSIFDFINPGLLGGAKAFSQYAKSAAESRRGYAPLRALVQPYILRRLKTDKRIIADLPDKTEVRAFCGLSKQQMALYQQTVEEMRSKLKAVGGIQRRGVVLASLMRFKQICNHPSQLLGDGAYDPAHSGKFQRLRELCEVMAARQEKVLIFTQFREITAALAGFLQPIFGRDGLILHGGTAVAERKTLVQQFQSDNGPPFFVLSLKAGGVGLNLTAASQVIHFDRWWNPAVENQATDRAFRIGQKKNVLVHKFVCRGTLEDKIDALIMDKMNLSKEILEGGADRMLTEMNNQELLNFVALDIFRAGEL